MHLDCLFERVTVRDPTFYWFYVILQLYFPDNEQTLIPTEDHTAPAAEIPSHQCSTYIKNQ